MFVRDKNTEVCCNNAFGPDSPEIRACDAEISKQDLDSILTPEQRQMIKQKLKESLVAKLEVTENKE